MDLSKVIELCLMGIGIIASFLLSCIAIYKSSKSNQIAKNANDLTQKINSKEYELSENLKYDVLKILADLKAIDAKIAAPVYNGKVNYKQEIESLSKIQSSPGYLLLLHSITDDDKRELLEETFRFFTMSSLKDRWVREWVHKIIDILRTSTNFEKSLNMEFSNLIKELCEMKSIYTGYDNSEAKKSNDITKQKLMNDVMVLKKPHSDNVINFKLRHFVNDFEPSKVNNFYHNMNESNLINGIIKTKRSENMAGKNKKKK